MTVWRPSQSISVKALGMVWKSGRFLASEVCRDDGTVKGVRPLGGHVEFGETWQDAVVREFREELEIDVRVSGAPVVLENIYSHHGETGHEVVFVAEVTVPASFLTRPGPFTYLEDTGTPCRADWYDLPRLREMGVDLYPAGLGVYVDNQPSA